MAVYVDDMRAPKGRMIFCHLIADTDDELHAMVDLIGVDRKWHQAPPKHDSHYDIVLSKRALAVKAGAIEITWKQASCMIYRRRIEGRMGTPESAERWARRQYRKRAKARKSDK